MTTADYCCESRDLDQAKRVLIGCAGMASCERAQRDFAFVRCLKRPKRSASSAFSLLEVEKRVRGEDSDVTEKLGKLWTWDNSVRGGQYKVLPVEKILHSLPLMPRFKPNSCEYSIDKGMYENPFKLCSRERPPFDWCRCREGSAI